MLSERVREILSNERLTHEEFAQAVGMNFLRARNIVSGRVQKLKPEEVRAIRERFKINPDWIEHGKGKRELPVGQGALKQGLAAIAGATREARGLGLDAKEERDLEQLLFAVKTGNRDQFMAMRQSLQLQNDMIYVPRHDVAASAGYGALVDSETLVDFVQFKRDFVTRVLGCDPDHVLVAQVKGDSMQPTLNEPDLVLLDTRKNTPKVEGVYFILRGDVLLVKRLRYKLKGDSVDVISDNHIKYPPETLTRHEMNELTIVGRVVWHAAKF